MLLVVFSTCQYSTRVRTVKEIELLRERIQSLENEVKLSKKDNELIKKDLTSVKKELETYKRPSNCSLKIALKYPVLQSQLQPTESNSNKKVEELARNKAKNAKKRDYRKEVGKT
ncbi:39017_t:CDS:2, partial [Gigaspora margarita]